MKKFLSLFLALAMLLTLVACGGTTSESSKTEESKAPESSKTEESKTDDSSEEEPAGDPRWQSLQTTDEPVSLLIYWHGNTPTVNEEPTEESPNVKNASRIVTNEWLADKPNVTFEWCRNFEMTDEWMNVNFTAGTGPDTIFLWGAQAYVDKGWVFMLDDVMQSPNYYEPGNEKWIDMYPEYLWDDSQYNVDFAGHIKALPVHLNPGPATAYYYNKTLFNEHGWEVPTDWDDLLNLETEIKAAGYTADIPYNLYLTPSVECWDGWASLSLYYCSMIPELDLDGDGKVQEIEIYKAQIEDGYFYLENNPAMVEFYDQLMYKYWNIYDTGVDGIDYDQKWTDGEVAIRQEGLWMIQSYYSNTEIDWEIGMFPAPVKQNSEYITMEIEWTEAGPYKPTTSVSFNVMEPSMQDRPEYIVDYVIDWLKYANTTANLSMQIEETGNTIGAVKGCAVPGNLKDWFAQSFPILPEGGSYLMPNMENVKASFTALAQEYGLKMIDQETWIHNFDELLYQGVTWRLENARENLEEAAALREMDISGWTVDNVAKPSWM